MRYTKNYKLKQPEADDYVLVEDFNENSDTVDELIKKIESIIGDLENGEDKDSLIKLIETLQKNKADLGKDGKVVPEQLPEVDLSEIENSITELESDALKLGETETTAYVGNKGKVAYDHSQKAHADPNAITEEKAIELLKTYTAKTSSVLGRGFSAIKIGEVTVVVVGSDANNSVVPVGYRPAIDQKVATAEGYGTDLMMTTAEIKTNGNIKISIRPNAKNIVAVFSY